MNRLQFKHVSQLFPSREAAIQFIESSKIDVDKPSRAALFAEPVVLKYGDSNEQHIIIAIGVNETENIFEYIDYYGAIEELNNIKGGTSTEIIELSTKIDALTSKVDDNKTSIDSLQTSINNVYTKSEVNAKLDGKASSNNLSALSVRVDTLESGVDELETNVSNKVDVVTNGNGAIEINGTPTSPSVGLKIDTSATSGNVMLEITENGLKASANITQFQTIVVDVLPDKGSSLYYYLLKTDVEDVYEEYVWSEVENGTFEFVYLGTNVVDLSNYVTNEELTNALLLKANVSTVELISDRVANNEGDITTLQTSVGELQSASQNFYTKSDVDSKLSEKANSNELAGIDVRLGVVEAGIEDTYNKDEVDNRLDSKVSTIIGAPANAIKVDSTLPSTPSVYLSIDVDNPGNVSLTQHGGSLSANVDLSGIENSINNIETELTDKVNTIIAIDGISVNTLDNANSDKIYNVGVKVNKDSGNVVITNSNEGLSANIELPKQFIERISATDNILTVGSDNDIKGNVNLYYESSSKTLYLYGKNNVILSEVDASAFFADAFIQSATYEPSTKELLFVINKSDGSTEEISIDMSELADTYFGGNGIEVDASNNINIEIDSSSENYLSVSSEGLKVSGVIASIDTKVKVESDRALAVESDLRTDIDNKVTAIVSTTDAIEINNSAPTNPTIDLNIDESSSKGNVDLTITGNGLRGNIPLGVGLKLNTEKQLTVNFAGDLTLDENGALVLDSGNVSDLVNYYTKTDVDSKLSVINNEIDNIEGEFDDLQVTLEGKADTSVTDGLDSRLDTAEAKLNNIAPGAEVNVQADWNVTDNSSDAYIANKPIIPSTDNFVTTDTLNNSLAGKANTTDVYTKTEVNTALGGKADTSVTDGLDSRLDTAEAKLNNIAPGAEVNVQADWNVTDNSSDAYIANKPIIPSTDNFVTTDTLNNSLAGKANTSVTDGLNTRLLSTESDINTLQSAIDGKVSSVVSGNGGIVVNGTAITPSINLKIDSTATAGNVLLEVTSEGLKATANVNQFQFKIVERLPDNGEAMVYYLVEESSNPGVYDQYVWGEVESGVFDFISLGSNTIDLSDYITNEGLTTALVSKADTSVTDGLDSRLDTAEAKLNNIASGAEVNVQADWNVTDTSSDAYIANKPTIPSTDNLVTTDTLNNSLATKANATDVYTKTEVNTALGGKADTSVTDGLDSRLDTAEADITTLQGSLTGKANVADVYTKTEVNTALGGKADTSVTDGLDSRLDTAETKLNDIAPGAEVNVIEIVQVNGNPLTINSKTVNVDLSPYQLKTGFETITGDHTILPNVYYTVSGTINGLNMTLGGTQLNNEYIFRFSTSTSPESLTITGATVIGIKPLKANKTYEVSILNGLALMAEI